MSDLFLNKLSLDDARLKQRNIICNHFTGKSGINENGYTIYLAPAQLFHKEQFATITLNSEDFVRFLKHAYMGIVSKSDDQSVSIPQTCQRTPTAKRKKEISSSWADPNRTHQHKHETVEIAVFGAKIDPKLGLKIDNHASFIIVDAAGRVSTAMEEINKDGGKLLFERGILWTINLDFSGDIIRQIKAFLSHNRDAKKVSSGTTLCTEVALIVESMKAGKFTDPANFRDKMSPAYVIHILYKHFKVKGSFTELLPWGRG